MANIAKLLTEHMDIWTAAESNKKSGRGRGRASGNVGSVYGVKKLRELILELAVRGKLVPQDPNDEPASELLKRIQTKTARQINPINQNSHELPKCWEWVYFGQIAQHNSGKTLDKGRNSGSLRDYITTSNLYWGKFELDSVKQMPIEESELERCSAEKGDLLICEGGEAGRAAVWTFDKEVCFQNHVHRARMYENISPFYAYRYFEKLNATGEIEQYRKGVGISNMSGKALASVIFALPPLAEQNRIVAKVDELMALCDQLEQQHSNVQEAHEILVSQLLATLTQSQNVTEFNANWQRVYAYFDVLFTTEASVDALKLTLLQLAVMGKLVSQDPNDEPASELIKRIQAEKARLLAEGKLKNEKPHAPINEEEKPFELPKGWEWLRLGELFTFEYGDNLPEPKRTNTGEYPVYGSNGIVGTHKESFVNSKCIVIGRKGSAGALNLSLSEGCCVTDVAYYCIPPTEFDLIFAFKLFHTLGLDELGKGIKPGLNRNEAYELVIAIPPRTEQHRIIAKVDTLMALCDQLKTRIQQANQQQQAIADALVTQAVQPTAEIIDLADYRAATACYTIKKMQDKPYFGRTAAVKILYLVEAHLGIPLKFQPMREAAGPLDKWIYAFEKQGEHEGWFKVIEPDASKTKVEYQVKPAIAQKSALIEKICSADQLKEFNRLLGLFADKTTEEAEIIATLFAAWNDFLIDGNTPSDDEIVKEVRENWHESKARFTPTQLKDSLNWMRRNYLVPRGRSPRTVYQQQLLN